MTIIKFTDLDDQFIQLLSDSLDYKLKNLDLVAIELSIVTAFSTHSKSSADNFVGRPVFFFSSTPLR